MATDFHSSASSIQLTLTAFMLGLALGQLCIGPLSDQWGRRKLLVGGTVVCIVASAACALAVTVDQLLVFRFLQGFSGAAGIVLSRAVISDRARGHDAASALGLLMAISGIAPIVAPLAGGVVVQYLGWQVVFWILTALAIAMAIGVFRYVGESHPAESRSEKGLQSSLTSLRTVLADRRFVGYTVAFVFGFGVMFSYIAASPFVLQTHYGLSTIQFSTVFSCNAIGAVLVIFANVRLVKRLEPRLLLKIGVLLLVVFTVVLSIVTLLDMALPIVLLFLWLSVASVGLAMANGTSLALEQVHRLAGTGSAILGAGQFALAAAVSPLVGVAGADTALPMVLTMVGCSVIAALGFLAARTARSI